MALAEETRFEKNDIVSRVLLRTPNSRTMLFAFAEGQELTEHKSNQHAMVEVLTGACEFSLAGTVHELKAGNFVYMPPNLPHAVRAKSQLSMLLTLIKPGPDEKPEER